MFFYLSRPGTDRNYNSRGYCNSHKANLRSANYSDSCKSPLNNTSREVEDNLSISRASEGKAAHKLSTYKAGVGQESQAQKPCPKAKPKGSNFFTKSVRFFSELRKAMSSSKLSLHDYVDKKNVKFYDLGTAADDTLSDQEAIASHTFGRPFKKGGELHESLNMGNLTIIELEPVIYNRGNDKNS